MERTSRTETGCLRIYFEMQQELLREGPECDLESESAARGGVADGGKFLVIRSNDRPVVTRTPASFSPRAGSSGALPRCNAARQSSSAVRVFRTLDRHFAAET
jgi:hypothetical protein